MYSVGVSDRRERFRRLKTGPADAVRDRRADPHDATGDLFEHFGVALDPPDALEPLTPAVEAAPCRHCGWLVAYRREEKPCIACGEPDPLAPTR